MKIALETALKVPGVSCTYNEAMTQGIGYRLGTILKGGSVIAMYGDLGSGKTVLARGIAKALGINEPVTSPTFNLVQEYQGKQYIFYHIDLYRITHSDDALSLGIGDFINHSHTVTVIEWAERAQDLIRNIEYKVYITYKDLNKRIIDIRSTTLLNSDNE